MSTSRTFIVGDCHGDNSYIYNIQHREKLTKNDYIIVCGTLRSVHLHLGW